MFGKRKDITRKVFLSYLNTKKLNSTNDTLYEETKKKKIIKINEIKEKFFFFFVIHLQKYRDAKILAKFMEIL